MKKFLLILTLICIPFFIHAAETQQTLTQYIPTNIDIQSLNDKVNLIEDINVKTLNSVYWTLGILAAIFLALISVNLYFNITGNISEIKRNKEQVLEEVKNKISFSEAKIIEKLSSQQEAKDASLKRELLSVSENGMSKSKTEIEDKLKSKSDDDVKKMRESLLNEFSNIILTTKAEIIEKITGVEKNTTEHLTKFATKIDSTKNKLAEMDVQIKDLEVFMYGQKGQQGEIIRLIELLSLAIEEKYDWRITSRLTDINKYVKGTDIRPSIAADLEIQLAKLDKNKNVALVSEIRNNIKLMIED